MADIPVQGKLVNKTEENVIVDWAQIDNKPDIDELLKGVTGNKIVTKTELTADTALRFEANTMYVIQCYDSSDNLADFTISSTRTGVTKTITGKFGMVWVGAVDEVGDVIGSETVADGSEFFDSLAVVGSAGSTFLTSSAGTMTLATTVTPSSGNKLFYYKIQGTAVEGGTEVEANPTGSATRTLDKLKVKDTVYSVRLPRYVHNITITGRIFVKTDTYLYVLAFLTITNGNYGAIDSPYDLVSAIHAVSGNAVLPCNGIGSTSVISDGGASNVDSIYAIGRTKKSEGYYLRFYKRYGSDHADYIDSSTDDTITSLKVTDYVVTI